MRIQASPAYCRRWPKASDIGKRQVKGHPKREARYQRAMIRLNKNPGRYSAMHLQVAGEMKIDPKKANHQQTKAWVWMVNHKLGIRQ